jgi:predicted secreted protein|nr:MAG TPA: PORTAL PROTEIN, 15 PROTEIN, HEAD PROTEIN, TAILED BACTERIOPHAGE, SIPHOVIRIDAE.6A [Caudoviricetes sp.]
MGKAKTVNGKDLMVFVADKATALATSHKLSVKADTSDAASKDDGIWDESSVTKMSWEASTEALVSFDKDASSYNDLLKMMLAGEPVDLISGIPANAGNEMPVGGWTKPGADQMYYGGKAIITSLDWTAAKGDNAKMTVSFKGVGALTAHEPGQN